MGAKADEKSADERSTSPATKKRREKDADEVSGSKKSKKGKKKKSSDSDSDQESVKKSKKQKKDDSSDSEENSKKSKKHKKKKSKHKKPTKKKKKKASSSDSDSSSGSSSDSDSDSGSDSGSSDDSDDAQYAGAFKKNKKKSKKDKKKHKKPKKSKKKKVRSMNDAWGKHGTITDEHRHAKAPEFFAWLYDVKNIDRSNLGHKEEREYFREYAEDYNTGTFPSDKYYNLAKWQANLPSKPESAYDDPTLTDEERVRLAKRDQKESFTKLNEKARIAAMVDSLRQAKAEGDSGYLDIVDRQMEKLKAATFESIAKERRLRKRDADDHLKEIW